MSEVFTTSGESSDITAGPAPRLQGLFIPGIDNSQFVDGFGVVTPWGGGGTARRYADYGISDDISRQNTQLSDLASSLIPAEGGGISLGLEGPQGLQGIPGRDGIDGIIHVMGLNLPQNSNFLAALPHNLDLISDLGTAADKLIYTSAYTAYSNFVWANTSIASSIKTWNESDINTDASFFIIAGDNGIYVSTDDGDSWDAYTPDSENYIQANCQASGGKAVVLGDTSRATGKIWTTTDYGANWTEKTVTVTGAATLRDTCASQTLFFNFPHGTTEQIGQTITPTEVYTLETIKFYAIYKYGDPGTCYVSLQETTDGLPNGNLLTDRLPFTVTSSKVLKSITFGTQPILQIGTKYAIVFEAPDGVPSSGELHLYGNPSAGTSYTGGDRVWYNGSVWATVSTQDLNFYCWGSSDTTENAQNIGLSSGGNFIVVAADNGVFLSTDFGDNWTRKTPDDVETTDWERGICSSDGTYIIVVSSANAIYRSANSGTDWAEITPAGGDTFSVNKLATSDDGQYMVIVGENTTDVTESCYISTDYGATWTAKKPIATSIEWTECDISNDGAVIAVSTTSYFYISLDSGVTWKAQGMASSAEVWEGLSISGDGTTGLVANTNDDDEFFIGTNTELYSEATWAESALTSAGRAILDDADAPAQATTLGLGTGDSPTWVGATLSAGPFDLSGKQTVGTFASPIDVTATRQYGVEFHYSGDDYDVTGIRSRARLKTTDTTATAQGALLQAANEDGINAGVLNGALIEAIGKSDGNAATIAVMRGALVNTEWGDYDTVTNLKTLHVRTHSRNAAGAGSFGTGYGIYIENEAVGGNGQALDAGIYFKGTNISGGNSAFTNGIDMSGATISGTDIVLTTGVINDPNGRWGVRTATPSVPFHILGDNNSSIVRLTATANTILELEETNYDIIRIKASGGGLAFQTDDTGSFANMFYIGIPPNADAFVKAGNGTGNAYTWVVSATDNAGIEFREVSYNNWRIKATGGFLAFQDNSSSSMISNVVFRNDSKVGFGGEVAPETLTEWTHANPDMTWHCSTHSDVSGSGDTKHIFKREDGAGTETACFQFEASHDGSGANDQLGKGIWSVNTGAGLVQALEIGSDLLATFAGAITSANYTAANLLTACATNAGVLDFSAASKTLTVEDTAVVSQDYSSDASPQFTGIELGHASDTTITRVSAGIIAIEGTNVAMVGGALHDGFSDFVANEHIDHTGVTLTAGTGLTGGGDISANRSFAVDGVLEDLDTLGAPASDGQFIVATGAGAFAYESGATARTSIGLGSVENTALSTWAGSANITTLGTITTVGNITPVDGGTVGRAAGPLLIFDESNGRLDLTGATLRIGGVLFGANTAVANTLDDYEEGTWTPGIAFGGGTTGITYANQDGFYTKIGNRVIVNCYMLLTSKGTSVGDAQLTGLPFTSAGGSNFTPGAIRLANISFADYPLIYIGPSGTVAVFGEITKAGNPSNLNNTDFADNSEVMFYTTYRV